MLGVAKGGTENVYDSSVFFLMFSDEQSLYKRITNGVFGISSHRYLFAFTNDHNSELNRLHYHQLTTSKHKISQNSILARIFYFWQGLQGLLTFDHAYMHHAPCMHPSYENVKMVFLARNMLHSTAELHFCSFFFNACKFCREPKVYVHSLLAR